MTTPGPRPPRHGRTWWERLAITGTIVTAVLCFLAAGSLVAGYMVVRNRDVVEIVNPAEAAADSTTTAGPARAGPTATVAPGETRHRRRRPPRRETFPPADPTASNFLLTGADNGACVDPDSPYAPAFGDEDSGRVGERSDTIMIMRVDPAAQRVAVLSFPRDLYVTIAGVGQPGPRSTRPTAATTRSASSTRSTRTSASAPTTSSRSTSARSRRSSTPSAA